MARKLARGRCIDLKDCARTVTGDYLLPEGLYREGLDYCDSSREAWIWSIAVVRKPLPSKLANGEARTLAPGSHLASLTDRFRGRTEAIECVWLR